VTNFSHVERTDENEILFALSTPTRFGSWGSPWGGFSFVMIITGIVMGVGAPQDTAKNGKTLCCIILSKELGFCRIYRIPALSEVRMWRVYDFECEKGSDYRKESYRFLSLRDTGRIISNSDDKRDILESCILKSGEIDPITYSNTPGIHQSIALVKLNHEDCDYQLSGKMPKGVDQQGECGWLMTQGKHWMKPYLIWKSQSGTTHKTHLGGREIYEYLRKNPDTPFRIFENLGFGPSPDFEHWALLGNQKDRPTVFLCVNLFRLKKQTSGSIPLCFTLDTGRKDGWPYLNQEENNVKTVDQQSVFTFTI